MGDQHWPSTAELAVLDADVSGTDRKAKQLVEALVLDLEREERWRSRKQLVPEASSELGASSAASSTGGNEHVCCPIGTSGFRRDLKSPIGFDDSSYAFGGPDFDASVLRSAEQRIDDLQKAIDQLSKTSYQKSDYDLTKLQEIVRKETQ